MLWIASNSKLAVEAANEPVTPEADVILADRNITVLPDILVNSGGVCVSYFEWVQNQANERWELDTVHRRLRSIMHDVTDRVFDRWQSLNQPNENTPLIDIRTVALVTSIERVTRVTLQRGISP